MSYYSSLAPFYDGFMCDFPYEEYAELCDSAFRAAKRKVTSVLDLACGTGTLSCLLAEKGYDVVACDGCPEMLSVALEKREGENPLFICQDMTELDLFGTVTAAVCSLDGLNHLPPEALLPVLKRVRLFMEPEGLFIFDLNSPARLAAEDGETFTDELEDAFCVWNAEYSAGQCEFFTDLFVREGELWRRESEEHTEYAYGPEQMKALLLEAGFSSAGLMDARLPGCEGREFWLAEA